MPPHRQHESVSASKAGIGPLDQSLRIAQVISNFPPAIGGRERACARLSDALAARGHEVTIITLCRDGLPREEVTTAGVRVLRVITPLAIGPLWGATYMRGVRSALMKYGPFDIIHGNQVYLHSIPMLGVARRTGAAVCSTIAATGARNDLAMLHRHRHGNAILQKSLTPLHTLIALTHASARDLSQWCEQHHLAPPPIEVLPNFVPEECFTAGRTAWPPTAIYVGRLAPEKQVPLLLDAFARAGVEGARLLIVGDGPERERIASQIARLNLGDRVEQTGAVDDPSPHLARAGIAVSASMSEGMSNALLEQFASGLGAIMPALPGMEEVFHPQGPERPFPEGVTHVVEAGVLYPKDDVDALARALRAELTDAARRERAGRAAAAIARAHYHGDVVVPRFIEFYQRLHAERGGRG